MGKFGTAVTAVAVVLVTLTAFVKYNDWVVIPRARTPIISFLKDPASAQFRDDRITKNGWLCGELNAKNGMGGYTGFKKYISAGTSANYIEGEGVFGDWSNQDLIDLMRDRAAVRSQLSKLQSDGIDIAQYSDETREATAKKQFFERKWKDVCEE